ncbi:proline racemase [Schnuerera sp.]|uniref:proline racemase n=1 Tax=Schnuerera sp. TaxID=2794844 RepID=UPI002BE9E047|nr:proline racemase [Schnuerera sp.]HSH35014.1 proline racemase [Schnuerera sp.]
MSKIKKIYAVDTHTVGEPTRIVVEGFPEIEGKTMVEKKEFLQKNMDDLRTSLILEPRGHEGMFGAVITSPVNEKADIGIIFMDSGGYLNMCGHGSIGVITVAIETGIVEAKGFYTNVVLDTPSGLIRGRAKVENGKVKEVSIINVPAFLYKENIEIELPDLGKIPLDIAFGGSFFAIVNAKDLKTKVCSENVNKLLELSLNIRKIINDKVKIQHPELKHIKTVDLVEIYDQATAIEADYKNVVVFGNAQIDRSPCGTGTSAKMATLYYKGQLKEGETFIYESILGTLFKGKIVGTTNIGNYKAIIPEITGSAYITGFNQYIIDPHDPLKHGFVL